MFDILNKASIDQTDGILNAILIFIQTDGSFIVLSMFHKTHAFFDWWGSTELWNFPGDVLENMPRNI